MDMKLLAKSAAIATGVGLSVLTSGGGVVHAAPSNPPPPCFNCQPDPQQNPLPPGYPGLRFPGSQLLIPAVGGGPKSGGRSVHQPGVAGAAPAGD
jgi:hypothetical protein